MTTPKVSTISRGGSRFYVHPETAEKVPGVTSVLGMLPKPFLRPWAAKVVAENAVDNLGEVVGMTMRGGRAAVIDFLKRAPDRETSAAADIGSEVHELFEKLALRQPIGRVHPDIEPFVEHFSAFLTEFSPEIIFTEETVWSERHRYAGSFDAFGLIDGEHIWLDWKTTRSGVHEDVALQLAAYRHADYVLRPDGSRVPIPEAQGGAVLHVRPEGWKLVPVACGRPEFEAFLHLRETFDWEREHKRVVLGAPLQARRPGGRSRPRKAV